MRGLLLAVLVSAALGQEKLRPVQRVVKLLQDMREELQSEMDADKKMYENMHCWCKNNRANKKAALGTANSDQKRLMAQIEELTALSARLEADISKTKGEVEKNQDDLKAAEEVRAKELAEFNNQDQDSLQAIGAIKDAIKVLSKHNPSNDLGLVQALKPLLARHDKMLGALAIKARAAIGMLQQPVAAKSYNGRSGEIVGILSQMKDRFEEQLSESTKVELKKASDFAELKKAKQEEIAAGYKKAEDMTQEKADADVECENAKNNLRDTNAALAADMEFLADLESKCSRTDKEYEARTAERMAEVSAVNDAIMILNDDSNRQLMDKTTTSVGTAANNVDLSQGASFLQMSSHRRSMRASAAAVLESAAKATHSPKLAMLATSAKLDAFTKVKKAIDDMISELKAQQQDEVEHRDWCVKEYNTNDKDSALGQQNLDRLVALEQKLKEEIARLTKEIDQHNEEIKYSNREMVKAGDNRASQNAQFQTTVNDQRATQEVLNRAYMRMKAFYDPDIVMEGYNDKPAMQDGKMMFRGGLFTGTTQDGKQYQDGSEVGAGGVAAPGTVMEVQKEEDKRAPGAEAPPPPNGFEEFKKNEGGNRVLGMLETVITDSKKLEAEAIQNEKEDQQTYETFIKDTNRFVKESMKAVADKTAQKAKNDESHVQCKADLKAQMTDLERLGNYKKDLNDSCNFVMRNFDMRQASRSQEMEALRQAKAILSGAQ